MYEDSSSWCISLICEFRMFNGHMPCIPAKGSKAILRQNRSHSSTHAWGLALASSKKFNLLNIILWTRALQPWDGLMTWSGAFVRCSARRHGSSTPMELRITIVDVRAGVCDSIISLQMNLTYHEAYLRHDIYVYDCMNACIVKWNDFDMHACMVCACTLVDSMFAILPVRLIYAAPGSRSLQSAFSWSRGCALIWLRWCWDRADFILYDSLS